MKDSKLTQKLMFRLLPAQILLASIGSINGIVSSLFAGNFVGVKAMSAVGLYSPINLALGAINTMIVGGSTILCGSHIGRYDKDGIHNVFVLNMVISGALALLATVGHLIFGLSGNLISVSGDPEVSRILSLYVLGQALGVFPLMVGNIMQYGMTADKKRHNVDLCLACKPDTLIMSIKDDCVPFDIEEKLKMMDQEDVTKNIGIRLVQGLASDLHYQNVLGLNVLTIKLDADKQ